MNNLLNKFNQVEVDTSDRLSKDFRQELENIYQDYLVMNSINLETLKKLESIEVQKETGNRFDRYITSTKTIISECKKNIRNTKHDVLSKYVYLFSTKYNISGLELKNLFLKDKPLSAIYTDRHYEMTWRSPSAKSFTFDEILDIDPTVDFISDIIFDKIGFQSLDDVLVKESKDTIKKLFKDDNELNGVTTYKNGMVVLKGLIYNTTSYHNNPFNIKSLRSFLTLVNLWCENNNSIFDKTLDLDRIKKILDIGSHKNSYDDTIRYDKIDLDCEFIESLQYFKNGNFKIKFKNIVLSNSFLAYCELI